MGNGPIVARFTLTARVNAAVRCNEKKERDKEERNSERREETGERNK